MRTIDCACGRSRDRNHLWNGRSILLAGLCLAVAGVFARADAQSPSLIQATPLGGEWFLRTGVLPDNEPKASVTPEAVLTIEGGGWAGHVPRVGPMTGNNSNFTAAFAYRAFEGDFVMTGRHILGEAVSKNIPIGKT